jgi:glycosyltransferase involved in cell wall biosynthesis
MDHINLRFVGLSKNCFDSLQKNISFIKEFKEKSTFEIEIIIIDSDSTDGTKEYCRDLLKYKVIESFLEIDNLSSNYNSRIERLTYCRNAGLKEIQKTYKDPIIYIPMDMDLDLFDLMSNSKLEELIYFFVNQEKIDCLLPFSTPYYYDIFALRKKGWVNGNALIKSYKLKKKYLLGSFLFNYIFIFRKQLSPEKFKTDLIPIESGFGGMGFYKISDIDLLNNTYATDPNNIDISTEHLAFNKNFVNINILKGWNIKAPTEHIKYVTSTPAEKFIYILKTIKYDFLGLFNLLKRKRLKD